jgi:hypothetical protein
VSELYVIIVGHLSSLDRGVANDPVEPGLDGVDFGSAL